MRWTRSGNVAAAIWALGALALGLGYIARRLILFGRIGDRSAVSDGRLLAELEHGIPLADAEQQVLEFISGYVKEPRKAALAGNSVGTDRTFLVRDMPRVEAHLHYRNVDVSSIKELVRRWYPRVYYATPAKTGNHRALA